MQLEAGAVAFYQKKKKNKSVKRECRWYLLFNTFKLSVMEKDIKLFPKMCSILLKTNNLFEKGTICFGQMTVRKHSINCRQRRARPYFMDKADKPMAVKGPDEKWPG